MTLEVTNFPAGLANSIGEIGLGKKGGRKELNEILLLSFCCVFRNFPSPQRATRSATNISHPAQNKKSQIFPILPPEGATKQPCSGVKVKAK